MPHIPNSTRCSACVTDTSVTNDVSSATEIFNQFTMRLKPLPLLELKSEAKCFTLKDLRGIDAVGCEQTGVRGQEYAGCRLFRGGPKQIAAGSNPCDV